MGMVLMALGIPVLIYVLYLFCTKPWIGFLMTLTLNYFIMGLTRYIPIPIPTSVLIEGVLLFLLVLLFARREDYVEEGKIPLPLLGIYSIWTFYCCAELMNDTCDLGIDFVAWFKDVRLYGFDPIICILIFALVICNKKDAQKFLTAMGIILILAAVKCWWQKNIGFDETERIWLAAVGAKTHILHAGTYIRYFSFFSDAANYGSHCAMMAVVYGVQMFFIPWKQWKQKGFYALVALGCLYGMFLSGARSAMFVLIGTMLAYIFLSRNWRMFSWTVVGLVALVGIMVFTNRGNSIEAVRRMRSAFNPNEASVVVRDTNKEAISKYLREAPLGIGLGKDASNVPDYNRYHVVATAAPDSSWVYFWMRTGVVGISLFCFVSFIILFRCATIVWFKLKDPELRTLCATFTAAGAGWFAAGYMNQVYFQYPNTFIVYGMLTIVFMAPYLDEKLAREQQQALEASDSESTND